ncbi:Hypothetical predicted protein [Pelobates cultripes]|uniref:Uncharacterized protein n=1 Tax=Pelobates cultripes TaxID=61616 RepID=A0AAD1S236_PELCU|nr:Hypothetical predicted protein [Pelobates cultripes]
MWKILGFKRKLHIAYRVFLDRTAPVPRATDRPDRRDRTILRHPDSRDTRVHLDREEDPDLTCVRQLGPQDFHQEGIQHFIDATS